VNSNESFSQVTAGGLHSCGLTVSGDAWCWGTNQDGAQGVTDGQLGDGTRTERISPVKVQTTLKFSSLFASNNLTCGISSGTAYCWGRGGHGALGNGSTKDQLVPTKVATSVGFKQLTGGPTFTCGLSADSSSVIYCWGSNSLGQLGNWTTLSTLTPQKAIWRIDP
jgi:alpha-tubulin suppressor-like RCC1 family protein